MRRVRTVEVIELQFRTAVDVPSDLVMCVSSGGQLRLRQKMDFHESASDDEADADCRVTSTRFGVLN